MPDRATKTYDICGMQVKLRQALADHGVPLLRITVLKAPESDEMDSCSNPESIENKLLRAIHARVNPDSKNCAVYAVYKDYIVNGVQPRHAGAEVRVYGLEHGRLDYDIVDAELTRLSNEFAGKPPQALIDAAAAAQSARHQTVVKGVHLRGVTVDEAAKRDLGAAA